MKRIAPWDKQNLKLEEKNLKKIFVVVLLTLLSLSFACKKATSSSAEEQAIRQTLETYLTVKKNVNLKALNVEYKNFQVASDHATVDVMFKSGSSNEMSIGFKYSLKKTAKGWEVEKSEATGGSMFGGHAGPAPNANLGAAPMAPATPEGIKAELPPGHPMVAPLSEGTGSAKAPAGGMESAHGKETPKK
jgi:hypothetical protein